jgi:hypothetical protein
MIDLFTPAELDTLADLNERILRHLAGEPCPEGWPGNSYRLGSQRVQLRRKSETFAFISTCPRTRVRATGTWHPVITNSALLLGEVQPNLTHRLP